MTEPDLNETERICSEYRRELINTARPEAAYKFSRYACLALPQTITRIRELEEQLKKTIDLFRTFAFHRTPNCTAYKNTGHCDCGFNAASDYVNKDAG